MRRCLKLVTNKTTTQEVGITQHFAPNMVMPYQDEDRQKRSIELPRELWAMIEADARRTFRSVNGMVTALLMQVYYDADVETRGAEKATVASPTATEMRQEKRRAG